MPRNNMMDSDFDEETNLIFDDVTTEIKRTNGQSMDVALFKAMIKIQKQEMNTLWEKIKNN